MEFNKRLKAVFGLVAIILAVIIGIAALYESGFRVSLRGIEKVGKGKVILTLDQPTVDVYLDNKLFTATNGTEEPVTMELEEGTHNIIVSKPGFWPWAKNIILPANAEVRFKPFLISQNPRITEISQTSDLFKELQKKFASHALPTIEQPLIKIEHDVALWLSEKEGFLMAFWRGNPQNIPQHFCNADECLTTYTVFEGAMPVISILYLDIRDDVALISTGGSVYALEISPFEQKNFQPVYKGGSPRMIPRDQRSIFVEDGGRYFVVQF